MITADFKIFNEFEDFIFVSTTKGEIIFQNFAAQKFFGKIKNFARLKHYFSIDSRACLLSTNFDTSVIDLLFESKQNFYAICSYQATSDLYYDLSIKSTHVGSYVIIKFKNVTQLLSSQEQSDELNKLQKKYDRLLETSKKIEKLKIISL